MNLTMSLTGGDNLQSTAISRHSDPGAGTVAQRRPSSMSGEKESRRLR